MAKSEVWQELRRNLDKQKKRSASGGSLREDVFGLPVGNDDPKNPKRSYDGKRYRPNLLEENLARLGRLSPMEPGNTIAPKRSKYPWPTK